jgi:hypothetical protein
MMGARNPDLFVRAVASSDGKVADNPFKNTHTVTLAADGASFATLDVFAADQRRVQRCLDDSSGCAIYLLGHAAHATRRGEELLRWCAQVVRDGPATRFRELGNFVVIIDERRRRTITFVSDVLGVRPWLIGSFGGRLVAGTDVLQICDAGLSNRQIDYDALSSWLRYNQDITGRSIVQDYRHIGPGSVCTFDATGQLISETPYACFEYGEREIKPDEMIETLHGTVSRTMELLVRDAAEVNLPLSGGYDSRLLFALALQRELPRVHATTVQTREYEGRVARDVAAAMLYPLQMIHSGGRVLDLFDDPFAFTAGGFPMGLNLTNMLARRRPGMPLVSGFLGDGLMRASLTPGGREHFGQDDRHDLDPLQLTRKVHRLYTAAAHRLEVFHAPLARNINDRAFACIANVVSKGHALNKPVIHTDLHCIHRFYFSQIFLQHLAVAEARLPYYSWELINFRLRHAYRCFSPENYPMLFRRHFPRLAAIPHSSQLKPADVAERKRSAPPTRHLRAWSSAVARSIPRSSALAAVKKCHLFRCLASGMLGEPHHQARLTFLAKLQLLEQRLRRCGIEVNWSAV